jgi:hypothetical protein
MTLVTIRTFDNAIDAHLMKSKLESEEIICFLFDENVVGLNPLYNLTVGGIKLKVREIDVDSAIEVINAIEKTSLTNDGGHELSCPRCSSTDLYCGYKSMKGIKGILSAIIALAVMIFPIYYKVVYKCKSCENEFTKQDLKSNGQVLPR